MSLRIEQLEKAKRLAGGIVQAQCPACAEDGHDQRGEHLRVFPDGRFGCCVFPKDTAHRKRIFALAGERSPLGPQPFRVRVRCARDCGRGSSVLESLRVSAPPEAGTRGTSISYPYVYKEEEEYIYKEREEGVLKAPGVESGRGSEERPYLSADGVVIFPADVPELYRWWKDGPRMTLEEIRRELPLGKQ